MGNISRIQVAASILTWLFFRIREVLCRKLYSDFTKQRGLYTIAAYIKARTVKHDINQQKIRSQIINST